MSQHPTRHGPTDALNLVEEKASVDTNDTTDAGTSGPSRRSFLQYAGIGLAACSLPTVSACTGDVDPVASPAPHAPPSLTPAEAEALAASAIYYDIRRRDDLLVFRLGLVNLDLTSTTRSGPPPQDIPLTGTYYLKRAAQSPSYLIVEFPPQHIFEQAFEENGNPKPVGGKTPVNAVIADPSRLVFIVPGTVQALPYELDKLLDALKQYQLSVSNNAQPGDPPSNGLILAPVFGSGVIGLLGNAQTLTTTRSLGDALLSARGKNREVRFSKFNPEALTRPQAAQFPQLEAALVGGAALGTITTPISVTPAPTATVAPAPTVVVGPVLPPILLAPTTPVAPGSLETSIELPFRLQISPNVYAQWDHFSSAQKIGAQGRNELWFTRMTTPQGWQKTIRALWCKDLEFSATAPIPPAPGYDDAVNPSPFLGSLTDKDRGSIVHCSSNYTLKDSKGQPRNKPVDANNLMLTALGGWLDAHGKWNDPSAQGPGLVAWDHVATMGRDHYVRAVYFGYLYPFGHKAVYVKVAQRKFKDSNPDTAYVWRREYVIVKEPLKTYGNLSADLQRGFPFTSLRFKTLVTPDLSPINSPEAKVCTNGTSAQSVNFKSSGWIATPDKRAFQFKVEAFDKEGNVHEFTTPCMFLDHDDLIVGASNPPQLKPPADIDYTWLKTDPSSYADDTRSDIGMKSQKVSYAEAAKPDDTRYTTKTLTPTAHWYLGTFQNDQPFVPQLHHANLDIDTIRGITGQSGAQPFEYHKTYLSDGFNSNNVGEVVLQVQGQDPAKRPSLDVSKQTHKSGGFASPSLNVSGLSRRQGIIGGNPDDFAKLQSFNPASFFDSAGANLFGCVPISGIISAIAPDLFKQTPKWLTQSLQTIETIINMASDAKGFSDQIQDQVQALQMAIAILPAPDASSIVPNGDAIKQMAVDLYPRLLSKAGKIGIGNAATQFTNEATALVTDFGKLKTAIDALTTAIGNMTSPPSGKHPTDYITDVVTAIDSVDAAVVTFINDLGSNVALPIDAGLRHSLTMASQKFDAAYQKVKGLSLTGLVTAFANAEDAIENLHIKLEWAPDLAPWPSQSAALFWPNDKHGFKVGVEIRGKAQDGMEAGADVYTSLTDFELRLLGTDPFLKLKFEKLIFKAGTDSKPDIDCVFDDLEFGGPLSFVNTLRKFIPLDGFSDPPNVQVTTEGLSAKFGLPLPNIACGMFSLENISINCGFEIPFIGKSLAVSFSFCTRESPFVLTVCMIGGGGFVGVTLTPDGVQKLELSLEATACLAIDFGVASGSISIAVGIYICIENKDCKLSGYVKFRGEVSVLEIVSASLELSMELSYESATGKVIGKASLEIHVSILCFGITVTVSVEKKFKGGNNDPTFRALMSPDATFANPWADYVDAFVPVAA